MSVSETVSVTDIEQRGEARGEQVRLCIPPDPKIGRYVRQEVIAFAETHGILDDDVIDFVAAIGEALANAIEHAQTREPIVISAWLADDRLYASVEDAGVGFTPTERTLSSNLPEAYAERGRGLPIMRRCSDVFRVQSAPGKGTRVTLGCQVHRQAGKRFQRAAS